MSKTVAYVKCDFATTAHRLWKEDITEGTVVCKSHCHAGRVTSFQDPWQWAGFEFCIKEGREGELEDITKKLMPLFGI